MDDIGHLFATWNNDAKKRSVGNVLAPHAEAELVEKLATSIERTLVCTYLLEQSAASNNPIIRLALIAVAADIGTGKHLK
jgi:hypothetical protein